MGVPALFRWLSRKYPKIISPVIEEDQYEIGGPKYDDANPNGEIDNLYLDMNGIVHPCSHPEHKRAPETEDEMFLDIFTYTDRVLMMARPRKVLMIAVDGVAPRAKMNQQRARRFRSAQDAKIKQDAIDAEIREKELRGEIINDAIKGKKQWDSNAITPGTPFMDRLAEALRYWIAYKLSNDPGWASLQVIISDATVPGEGEHKLMSFIRSQRSDPQYDPNTKHCIYGLDADLIFLGLATHEPHFRVLREDVFAQQSKRMTIRDQVAMTQEADELIQERDKKKPFLWLHVNILREYLAVELFNPQIPFSFDLERSIDDWVFICFFAGNDFLPHLPSLDVRDNGIDILVNCWKNCLPTFKDYVTCDGKLNLDSVEKLMAALAVKEDQIFKNRHVAEQRREERNKQRKIAEEQDKALKSVYLSQVSKGKEKAPLAPDINMPLMDTKGKMVEGYAKLTNNEIVENTAIITKANLANADAAAALKKLIDSKKNPINKVQDQINNDSPTSESETSESEVPESESTEDVTKESPKKRKFEEVEEETDDIKLYEPGYQNRYYEIKFHCKSEDEIEKTRKDVVLHYLEGIAWVSLYYYQGCPSWKWYFPYHYAPFASDFTNLKDLVPDGIKFDLGEPFKPYEQLMSVLPADSRHTLPKVFHDLMISEDSDIIDFYPEEFKIDMNGKKMAWQGIPLLPFIDEKRLLDSVQAKYKLLTEDELNRNINKQAELFISPRNKNYNKFHEKLYKDNEKEVSFKYAKSGLAGTVLKYEKFQPESILRYPLKEGNMPNVKNNEYFQTYYNFPEKKTGKSMILNGHISAIPALTTADKNNLIYQLSKPSHMSRFTTADENREYINTGPAGKELFKCYSMRRGGYRSYMINLQNGGMPPVQPRNQSYRNPRSQTFNNAQYNNNRYNNQQNGARSGYLPPRK
ncbi:unnamed protein product [Candida verbasci]|uniref:5'-3' exoribonuclease n=1 Tax=Candida verbasci TaxID=1227364 RepID=A0A9W4TYK0_9ASCO|nr:unnamed protein product [Candida verbasci]